MTGSEILRMQFDRLAQEFKNTLGNLGAQRLAWRPAPRANDIGALLWHSARAWDGYLFYLDGATEVFVTGNWQERFEMKTTPKNGMARQLASPACKRKRKSRNVMSSSVAREMTTMGGESESRSDANLLKCA